MPSPAPVRARLTELPQPRFQLTLGSFQAEFLHWGHIGPTPWRNHLHTHSFFEICYAYAGQGVFRMLGTAYPVRAGEVFIAKPGEEHEILAENDDPLAIWFWAYTLAPGPGEPDPVVDALLRDFLDSRTWVSARVPGMGRTLELLNEEAERQEPGYRGVVAGLTTKLLLDTARAICPPRPGEPVPEGAQPRERVLVERVRRYIHDNLARPLAMVDLASQVGLSERHLTRLFHRVTGHAPMAYLTERRMEAAGQLLLSGMPIKEIAPRVGYPDVRYFTTVFRQAMGLPPAAYRAQGGTLRQKRPRADLRRHRS